MTEEPKLDTISFSRMGTYKSCPRKWKHTYIDRRVLESTSYDAVKGNFVHDVFEFFYKLPAEQRTIDAAKAVAAEQFATFSQSEDFLLLHLPDEEAIKQFKRDSWDCVRALWQLEDPTQIDVHSTELPFRVEFDGITMNGFIDRIERTASGEWLISDYKSGKAPLRKYLTDKVPQLVLYAKAIEEQEGMKATKGAFLFLGGDKPKREQITITPTRVSLECARIVRTQEDINESIAKNDFPVNTGPLCAWCPHSDICPEGQRFVRSLVAANRVRQDAPALSMEWFTESAAT